MGTPPCLSPLILLLLLSLSACPGREAPVHRGGKKGNLLFILVDTLRSDRLSSYGYTGARTPAMDRLASEGVLYRRAVSAAPWTCPSVASIFTGRFPEAHGMVYHPVMDRKRFHVLSHRLTTLAEVLHDGGYHTEGLSEQVWVSPTFGFDQGFDSFEVLDDTKRLLADRVLARLPELARKQPFFLYVHFLDPHTPYAPPEGYRPAPPVPGGYGLDALDANEWWRFLAGLGKDEPAAEDLVSYLEALYDGEVRFVDHEIGRILAGLDARGLADDTAVLLVSDHGEGFLEHGMLHGFDLFNEGLFVPWILRVPWRKELAGTRVETPVSTVDILPTLCVLLGLPLPAGIQGRPAPPFDTGGPRPPPLLFSESAYDRTLKKVQTDRYSLVYRGEGVPALFFDLASDPREQEDVKDLHVEAFKRLWKSLLHRLHEERTWKKPTGPAVDITPEVEDRLRGLGYIR